MSECGTGGVVVGAAGGSCNGVGCAVVYYWGSLVLPVVLVLTVCVVGEERDRGGG